MPGGPHSLGLGAVCEAEESPQVWYAVTILFARRRVRHFGEWDGVGYPVLANPRSTIPDARRDDLLLPARRITTLKESDCACW